jgi:hypothetical protein
MNIIKLSHNWNNKLSNDVFTTIRLDKNNKQSFYGKKIGEEFVVLLNGKETGKAILRGLYTYKFHEIDVLLLQLDTGELNVEKIFDIFKKFGLKSGHEDMLILVFQKKKEETKKSNVLDGIKN